MRAIPIYTGGAGPELAARVMNRWVARARASRPAPVSLMESADLRRERRLLFARIRAIDSELAGRAIAND